MLSKINMKLLLEFLRNYYITIDDVPNSHINRTC